VILKSVHWYAIFQHAEKEGCLFYKCLDKLVCERGIEVLPELLKKVKDLDNENNSYMARVKDLENKSGNYMAWVKHLEKEDGRHMEMINYLQKDNNIYRARGKKIIYIIMFGLLLLWLLMLLVGSIALTKQLLFNVVL
jgi:hypothetical protein